MPTASIGLTYGAIFVGLLFATFLQGVLSLQSYVYYETRNKDTWKMKSLVAGVWGLDLVHLVFIAHATYHYLVINYGNPEALASFTWSLDLHLAIVGLVSTICRTVFLHRIWVFSNYNKSLAAALVIICLATFGVEVTISVHIFRDPLVADFSAWNKQIVALFAMSAGTDALIAFFLCHYIKRGKSGYEMTNYIVAKVLRYTVTTGLATSILSLVCLLTYIAIPQSFIFIAIHFSLARMYTNSLLASLNSRRNLRAALDGRDAMAGTTNFGMGFQGNDPAYGSSMRAVQFEPSIKGITNVSQTFSHGSSFKGVHDHEIELHSTRN